MNIFQQLFEAMRSEAASGMNVSRTVSQEWLRKSIIDNRELAQSPVEHSNASAATVRLSAEEAQQQLPRNACDLKEKRRVVTCRCQGEVENCQWCFGSGRYFIDGYGNEI